MNIFRMENDRNPKNFAVLTDEDVEEADDDEPPPQHRPTLDGRQTEKNQVLSVRHKTLIFWFFFNFARQMRADPGYLLRLPVVSGRISSMTETAFRNGSCWVSRAASLTRKTAALVGFNSGKIVMYYYYDPARFRSSNSPDYFNRAPPTPSTDGTPQQTDRWEHRASARTELALSPSSR